MQDPDTGLSHAALTGQRPQSVEDAERLLSYHVASSMQKNGFDQEAEYILTVASWHEASDGRGLSQLDRCKSNHQMLNYLLDELWLHYIRYQQVCSPIELLMVINNEHWTWWIKKIHDKS